MTKRESSKIHIATNKKGLHNHHVLETFEAGIALYGPEVKSLRLKQVNIEQSFALAEDGEVNLINMHISPYKYNSVQTIDADRTRKLLLKKNEIKRIFGKTKIKGNVLIPTEIYFRNGWAKVTLAIAKSKKSPDKRTETKTKDLNRELRRDFKDKFKG
jgi:SsrA-binding protein